MTSLPEHSPKPLLKLGPNTDPSDTIIHSTMLQVAGAIDIERHIMKHDDHAAHHTSRFQHRRNDVGHVTKGPVGPDQQTGPLAPKHLSMQCVLASKVRGSLG